MNFQKSFPLVSILIPTYNQPEFFRQALESAINQDYPNIEIIVSDDSTDDRVKNVFDSYKDCERSIKYIKHGGYTHESAGERALLNMENLLEHAQGEFINILYHDDLIYPDKISTMMDIFMSKIGDKIAIISSARNVIDGFGNTIQTSDIPAELNMYQRSDSILMTGEEAGRLILIVCGNFIGELSTVLVRRKDFYREYIKKFSTGYFLGVKDRSMWDVSTYLEIFKNGQGILFFKKPFSAFRISGGNQNTYNGNVRMDVIVDWLSFATAAYIHDCYIHDRKDFGLACEYWLYIAEGMISFFKQFPDANLNINLELLDQIMRAVESVEQKNFDVTFNIGVEWIKKYSSRTFDARYLR